jgi:hypothetical protein
LIIWVDDALFAGQKPDVDLLALLRQAALRRHTLIISASPQTMWNKVAPNFAVWQQERLTPRLQEEVKFLLERLSHISSNLTTRGEVAPIRVSEQDAAGDSACVLTLAQAIRAVVLPLHILVENQINDAAFLRQAMPPVWRDRLTTWEQNGELRFMQAGGIAEMRRMLEFHADDEQARQAFGLPAKVWLLQYFLIYDHDGEQADQTGDQTKALERAIKNHPIAFHRLWRRCQENYLPQPSLLKIVVARELDADSEAKLTDAVNAHCLQAPEVRHYCKLPRLGDNAFFKNEFFKPANAGIWAAADFEADGIWPEMVHLAEAIAAAI